MRKSSSERNESRGSGGGILGIIVLLIIWKIVSLGIGAEIILPSPERTFKVLLTILSDTGNYLHFLYTVIRGLGGFCLAVFLALVLGIPAGMSDTFRQILNPLILVLRSTPVISIILLALIWFSSGMVPVFVAFLMIFPIVCTNVIQGILSMDPNLVEMSKVYELDRRSVLRWLYAPSLAGYLYAGLQTAGGLTWKVVIAAEVLSRPEYAIGTSLQEARIYLETARVFAWTLGALALSWAFNTLIQKAIPRFFPGVSGIQKARTAE